MSVIQAVQVVPRTVIDGYLRVARLPLTAVGRITGQQRNPHWAPGLAFDSLEASVDSVLGGLLRDEVLVRRGRLQQARIAELRRAGDLRVIADQERAEARAEMQERREDAEQRRRSAAAAARRRTEQIEQAAEEREHAAQTRAAERKAAARRKQAEQEKAIERKARRAKADTVERKARALETAEESLEAQRDVERLDIRIEANKAARRRSS